MRLLFLTLAALTCAVPFLQALPEETDSFKDHLDLSAVSSVQSHARSQMLATSSKDAPSCVQGIDLVEIGDCNNIPDPDTGNSYGMVTEEFSMGQYDVTARQYCEYLNEVATGDNYLRYYDERMGTDPNVASIKREVNDGKNQYSIIVLPGEKQDRGNFPIVYVSLYQAARFCNWLQNKSTHEFQGEEITERGAYTLDGITNGPIARNTQALWFLPTENEWYKAAYYKGNGLRSGYWDYPNRSMWAPYNQYRKVSGNTSGANYNRGGTTEPKAPFLTEVGAFKKSVGSYNNYDMGGNVAQWTGTEENQGGFPLTYIARGGSWKSLYYSSDTWGISELSKKVRRGYDPSQGYDHVGFRVASSQFVNSPPPGTEAPGETELSSATLENGVIGVITAAAVIGGGVMGKKAYENHAAAVEEVRQNDLRPEALRMREDGESSGDSSERSSGQGIAEVHQSESDFVTPLQQRDISNGSVPSSSDQGRVVARLFEDTPETRVLSKEEQVALFKQEIQASISTISSSLEKANHDYRELFAQPNHGQENIAAWQQVASDYNNYVENVVQLAQALHDNLPNQFEVWVPWYEQMRGILMASVVRNYAFAKAFNLSEESEENRDEEAQELTYRFSNAYAENANSIISAIGDDLKGALRSMESESMKTQVRTFLEKQQNDMVFLTEGEQYVERNELEKLEGLYQTYVNMASMKQFQNPKQLQSVFCLMTQEKEEPNSVAGLSTEVVAWLETASLNDFVSLEESGSASNGPLSPLVGFGNTYSLPVDGGNKVLPSPSNQKRRRSSLLSPAGNNRRGSLLPDTVLPDTVLLDTINPQRLASQDSTQTEQELFLRQCGEQKKRLQEQEEQASSANFVRVSNKAHELLEQVEEAQNLFQKGQGMRESNDLLEKLKGEAYQMKAGYLLKHSDASMQDQPSAVRFQNAIDTIDRALWHFNQSGTGSHDPVLLRNYLDKARAIAEGD